MIESISIDNPMSPGDVYKIGGLTRFNFLVGKNSHGKSLAFWQIRMQLSKIKEHAKPLKDHLLNLCGSQQDRIASIVFDIYARNEGYIFIENIEEGVHYTCYKSLLETLLYAVEMHDVQLFATTDSKEMLHSIKDLPQELGQQFSVHRTNLLIDKSTDYTYSEIVFCAEENNNDKEMRGL